MLGIPSGLTRLERKSGSRSFPIALKRAECICGGGPSWTTARRLASTAFVPTRRARKASYTGDETISPDCSVGWVFDRQIGPIRDATRRDGTRPTSPVHDGRCDANALSGQFSFPPQFAETVLGY